MGNDNLFELIRQHCRIKIGNRNKISAGMIIDTDVGDSSVVFYRFKERLIAIPRDIGGK